MWKSGGTGRISRGFSFGALGLHCRYLFCGFVSPSGEIISRIPYYSQERDLYPFSSGTQRSLRSITGSLNPAPENS